MSNSKYLNTLLLQYQPENSLDNSISKVDKILNKQSIKKNTLVICPELSFQKYICIKKDDTLFDLAIRIKSLDFDKIKYLAVKHKVYLCITFFEKCRNKYFNTAAIISPNGEVILKYHKKNIPSEMFYEEKYYFQTPKNNFKYFYIAGFKIGVMICWDQWHMNSYAFMKKNNINLIICPTAIGHCFYKKRIFNLKNEQHKWFDVIKANSLMINTPMIVANRIGNETEVNQTIKFWGNSFITDCNGNIVKKCQSRQSVVDHKIDFRDQNTAKRSWNFLN